MVSLFNHIAESQIELLETAVEETTWPNLIARLALGRKPTEHPA
jgi:hypothetical protein